MQTVVYGDVKSNTSHGDVVFSGAWKLILKLNVSFLFLLVMVVSFFLFPMISYNSKFF